MRRVRARGRVKVEAIGMMMLMVADRTAQVYEPDAVLSPPHLISFNHHRNLVREALFLHLFYR